MYMNMKKAIIALSTGLLFTLSSCSDFLDQAPIHTPDETTFWKTEGDALMAVNNLYTYLPKAERWWTECYSDNATMTNAWGEGGMGEMKQGNITAAVSHIQSTNSWSLWRYDHIRQILYFLSNVDKVPFNSDATRKQMEGEARFILAIKYFHMVRAWGDVPLIKEKPLTLEESQQIGKSSAQDVMAYVLENANKAVEYLPDTHDKSGRITRDAARMLKAEVLMWMASFDQFHGKSLSSTPAKQLWQEAAKLSQEVINSNRYKLEDNFVTLFESVTNNKDDETILARQYVKDQITNMTNLLGIPGGVSLRGGGWASFSAPRDLVDDYECTDGKTIYDSPLYSKTSPWENRDKRLISWFLLPFKPVLRVDGTYTPFLSHPNYKDTNREAVGGEGGGGRTGYWCTKYVEMDTYENNGYQHWIIYRYAETLLFLAECLNESDPGNAQIAWALDQVRARGGLPSVAPLLGNQAEMRKKILHERRVELTNEDKRYWDLLRTKQAEVFMNPTGNTVYGINENIDDFNNKTGDWTCAKIIAEPMRFDATKGYVWPVPQDVMDKNKNITQTDAWK